MKKLLLIGLLISMMTASVFSEATSTHYTIGNMSPWAEQDISEAIQSGLIEDNTLLEDASEKITRQAFCQTIISLHDKITFGQTPDSLSNPFSDTDNPAIIKAFNLGIVSGRGDGSFGPNLPIKREEMAVMIANTIDSLQLPLSEATTLLDVQDQDQMASWSIKAIQFVNHHNYMTGDGKNFNPKSQITIEESVVILNRVYKNALEKSSEATYQENNYGQLIDEVIRLTNIEREKQGLDVLIPHNDLAIVARDKAIDMVENNYFSHTSPTYGSPFDMMDTYNLSYQTAGENIAYGQESAEEVVTGWMNSPGHRANILNSGFSHIAIGVDQNDQGQLFFVQLFLTPFK